MKALDPEQISAALTSLPGWRLDGGKLIRNWTFQDFAEAMLFVNEVATIAERAGHHPDIDIRYNRVALGLVTHDAGGITERDVAMAGSLSGTFPHPQEA